MLRDTPQCSEAHYYYGYTLDRLYSISPNPNIRDMITNPNRQDMEKISSEFEWILKNEGAYKGAKYMLNPVGKLTSIWGSLALKYLKNGTKDSIKWAFTEGRRRGGFSDVNLEFAKNLLQSCPQNAVLFTWGDSDSYPLWYLQYLENFRTDVAVINLSLLQTSWFIKLTKNEWQVPYGKTDAEIDALPEYFENYATKERTTQIEALPNQKPKTFSWLVPPSQENYLLKADFIISELVKNNRFRRPICYSLTAQTDGKKLFKDYLVYRGLVVQLVPSPKNLMYDAQSLNSLKNVKVDVLQAASTKEDNDNEVFTTTTQYAFLMLANDAIFQKKDKKMATHILTLLENKLPKNEQTYDEKYLSFLETLNTELKKMK